MSVYPRFFSEFNKVKLMSVKSSRESLSHVREVLYIVF